MEAKDTVINQKQIQLLGQQYEEDLPTYDLNHYILKAQAEISFKAGIREVVGALGLCCYIWHDEENKAHLCLDQEAWQARLKEWGLK